MEGEPAAGSATPFAATLSAGDRERFSKMNADLRWLISEGYVMEFMDGRLFIPPPVAAARRASRCFSRLATGRQ